jgi:hypothetical protein
VGVKRLAWCRAGAAIALLAAGLVNAREASADTFGFSCWTVLPPACDGNGVIADTNHDGRLDLTITVRVGNEYPTLVLEYDPPRSFREAAYGPTFGKDWAGDIDGDGLSEIVGEANARVVVVKSVDEHSYPTRFVWAGPPVSFAEFPHVFDPDQDGRSNILCWYQDPMVGDLRNYEHVGDDEYVFRSELDSVGSWMEEMTVADLDLDGLNELAFGSRSVDVRIYTCERDDTFTLEFYYQGVDDGLHIASGDVDRDGWPEVIVSSRGRESGMWGTRLTVFEARGADVYEVTADWLVEYSPEWGAKSRPVEVGDVDGDGELELVAIQTDAHFGQERYSWELAVYESPADDTYEQVGTLHMKDLPSEYGRNGLVLADADGDGAEEIYWLIYGGREWNSFVLESRAFQPDVEAPSPVTNLRIEKEGGSYWLVWEEEEEPDYAGVMVFRGGEGCEDYEPVWGLALESGMRVHWGVVEAGLVTERRYRIEESGTYGVFARDAYPNYAPGVWIRHEGTWTPTPTWTATPTPAPTLSPTVTPSATVTATATVTPRPLGVRLELSDRYWSPGEVCWVRAHLDNPGSATLAGTPVFFVLEALGRFYFWPGWSSYDPGESGEIDYALLDVPPGGLVVFVLPPFTWPETGDRRQEGLRFYGAMVRKDLSGILGEPAVVEWGYGPP